MNPLPLRAIRAILALTLLLGATAAAPPPTTAQPTLTSNPSAIEATLALGSTRQLDLTLTNNGSSALTPQLFEAEAAPATAGLREAPARAQVPLPRQRQRVDPQIGADLAAAPDGRAEFLVFLADQADLAPAYAVDDWAARGAFVYQALRDHAARSQAGLRAMLDARGLDYTPLWVANALIVRGGAADVAAISGRAEVALLRADRVAALLDEPPAPAGAPSLDQVSGCTPNERNACWNIAKVGADRVWANFGVRGQGVVVANIDSGVNYTHPALVGQYRGNLGGGAFEHNYNWYDPYRGALAPVDSGNHGTHTMGTMVARGTADPAAPAVGVAPGARWIAARGCATRSCSEADLIMAAQWMLAPTDLSGANPRPDLRPHIVNNSWSSGRGDNNWYAGYTAAWRAAGIFSTFAAGNTGNLSGCATIQSPGGYSDVVGVGAVDRDDLLPWFSSIGPTTDGRIKPDLTAPGSGVPSTIAEAGQLYDTLNGTSMAAPHVAGAAALLWSANPDLVGDLDATYAILTTSALPRVDDSRFSDAIYANCQPFSQPNNLYGYGRLDTYAAVAQARVDLPWLAIGGATLSSINPGGNATLQITLDARRVPGPGVYQARVLVHTTNLGQAPLAVPVTLTVPASPDHATVSGLVRRADDGTPLAAQVRVAGGPSVSTGSDGRFSLTLPPAAGYTLVATAFDYAPLTRTLALAAGQASDLQFDLQLDRPKLTLDSAPRSAELAFGAQTELRLPVGNAGTRPVSYTLSLPAEAYGVWRSDQDDEPQASWIAPPSDAVTLSLTDDGVSQPLSLGFDFPYFDRSYSQAKVVANGFISLGALTSDDLRFTEVCLPLTETPEAAIVPLRLDLNPSKGGRVSYARTAAGFLVTWEDVPMYGDEQRTMSFQALLRRDGRISFSYRDVGDLRAGDFGSAGLQRNAGAVQRLGCKGEIGVADGLTVELRPQLSSADWIELPAPQGQIAPGQTAQLPVRLRWAPPVGGWASSGTILLTSNDPQRATVRLTVRLRSGEAPHRVHFPYIDGG